LGAQNVGIKGYDFESNAWSSIGNSLKKRRFSGVFEAFFEPKQARY
jgi:hypothetical protein